MGGGEVLNKLKTAILSAYISSLVRMETLMYMGITKIYCGHYPYVKKAYDRSYIQTMLKLAKMLDNGTARNAVLLTGR